MATITITRLSQTKNRFGSFSYRIISGEVEEGTKTYGDNEDILYSNQKIGVWNTPVQVIQFLGKNKTTGKTYTAFSIDKEMNQFTQRGHTATLAINSGLDADKIAMLKMLGELDEQEIKVMLIQRKLNAIPSGSQPLAVNPSVSRKEQEIEDAEIVEDEAPKKEPVTEEGAK